jgi:hypothetical protein
MRFRNPSFALCAFSLLVLPGVARADCAAGADYEVTVAANTVTVCPQATEQCGNADPLLREDESTGTVVVIGNSCDGNGCYLDECVPAGTYRYGYETPFSCSEQGCGGVAFFEEGTVTTALPATCTRTPGNAAPTPTSAEPPWGTGPDVSGNKPCSGGCATSLTGTRGKVLSIDMLVLGAGALAMALRARRARRRPARVQR